MILAYPENNEDKNGYILVVGLNPALQKSLIFSEFMIGEVNRAERVTYTVGGKGANFSRAAKNWGIETLLFQFAGGDTGKYICRHLEEEKIPFRTCFVNNATRTCTTCLCKKKKIMTELIEPSAEIELRHDIDCLMSDIKKFIPKSKGVALCGTFPPGISGDFYASIAKEAKHIGIPILLDAYKDITPVLDVGPHILKINIQEIKTIAGENSLEKAVKKLFSLYDIRIIAVTNGARNAYLIYNPAYSNACIAKFSLPKISGILNTLGAGDTVSAIFFGEYIRTGDYINAFRLGIAAGTASCLSLYCGDFSKHKALNIADDIAIISRDNSGNT